MHFLFKKFIYSFLELIALPLLGVIFLIVILFKKRTKPGQLPRLVWGADPIISNKYWSESLKEAGYFSKTLMNGFYSSINKKEDYDLYVDELAPIRLPANFSAYYAFFYAVYHFDIIHHPAHGFLLRFTLLKRWEGFLLRKAGCKNIVLPYGADILMYSRINNTELRHALLLSYPSAGKIERKIQRQVEYWIWNSSFFFPIYQTDGIGYWDILCYSYIVIDEKKWQPTTQYSKQRDGISDTVRIIHSPNHRGVKGTEFIIKAVEDLKKEGLKVELILLEKISNDIVKEYMDNSDILVEQLIFGHGLSAIEGMAKGLAVISNFEDEQRNKVFRTYSYLNECPIVSASPENITDVLRKLVKDPALREELGRAGRKYIDKYHSYAYGQFVFGEIYKKIWHDNPTDIMNIFHPAKPASYNNVLPFIKHPLIKNKLS